MQEWIAAGMGGAPGPAWSYARRGSQCMAHRCELGRVAVLQCIPSPLNTLFYCAVCANGNEEQPLLCPNTLACVDLDS
eukprot:scaffold1448_cov21-Tisochrysis_lutea.AAC.2